MLMIFVHQRPIISTSYGYTDQLRREDDEMDILQHVPNSHASYVQLVRTRPVYVIRCQSNVNDSLNKRWHTLLYQC
jgi:hypothetical protein